MKLPNHGMHYSLWKLGGYHPEAKESLQKMVNEKASMLGSSRTVWKKIKQNEGV